MVVEIVMLIYNNKNNNKKNFVLLSKTVSKISVKKWVESDRICIEQVKQKKDICLMVCLFANAFRLQSFVWIQKYQKNLE